MESNFIIFILIISVSCMPNLIAKLLLGRTINKRYYRDNVKLFRITKRKQDCARVMQKLNNEYMLEIERYKSKMLNILSKEVFFYKSEEIFYEYFKGVMGTSCKYLEEVYKNSFVMSINVFNQYFDAETVGRAIQDNNKTIFITYNLKNKIDYLSISDNTAIDYMINKKYSKIIIKNLDDYKKRNPGFKFQIPEQGERHKSMIVLPIAPRKKNIVNNKMFGVSTIFFRNPLNPLVDDSMTFPVLDNISESIYYLLIMYEQKQKKQYKLKAARKSPYMIKSEFSNEVIDSKI